MNKRTTDEKSCMYFTEVYKLEMFFRRKKVYRVAQKSRYRKKIEYLHYGSSKRADFFVNDTDMFKLYVHKDMLRETLF